MEKLSLKELSSKALIELARKCMAKGDCLNCALYDEESCNNALIMALADKLEEAETKWIPCKLARPAEADEYLVMIAGAKKPTVLYYDVDEEAFFGKDNDLNPEYYLVTHWAMMPEGPVGAIHESPDKKVRRCATCRHEDKMAECDRCVECEKHSLWEERNGKCN